MRGPRGLAFDSALEFLASQGSPVALEILLRDVSSNVPKIRESAAKLLEFYPSDNRALAALLKLETDADRGVRYWAQRSIDEGPEATKADKASRIEALRQRGRLTR